MSRLFRSLVLFGLLLGIPESMFGQAAMPPWFWKPLGPGWCEVFAKTSVEAIEEAASVLTAYRHSLVQGSFQQFYDDSVDEKTWRNTDYSYNFSQKMSGLLRNTIEVKERYPVNIYLRQYVYLVGPKESAAPLNSSPIEPVGLPRPSWASLIGDESQGRLRAVGEFTLSGNPSDAWTKAEELAIFQLLRTKQVTIGQVTQAETKGKSDRYASMQWIKLNFSIENVRVDGRWVDPDSGDALVLVSAPVESIRLLGP